METTLLEELRRALKKEQARLRAVLGAVAKEDGRREPKFVDMGRDTEASEDEAEQLETNFGAAQALESTLLKVEHALDKIERGIYGVCEKCGADISTDRLKAVPEAEYCLEHE